MSVDSSNQAVHAHLGILQAVIQRMAANSASCKTWCITLVSAILVIVADKGKPQFTILAIGPTLLFLYLDAYYLRLEKQFRNSYNKIVRNLHNGKLTGVDLFVVAPVGNPFAEFIRALLSSSVWPFYLLLTIMVLLGRLVM